MVIENLFSGKIQINLIDITLVAKRFSMFSNQKFWNNRTFPILKLHNTSERFGLDFYGSLGFSVSAFPKSFRSVRSWGHTHQGRTNRTGEGLLFVNNISLVFHRNHRTVLFFILKSTFVHVGNVHERPRNPRYSAVLIRAAKRVLRDWDKYFNGVSKIYTTLDGIIQLFKHN